jgi:hypothetical protein
MPETATHLDHRPVLREYEVGTPWKATVMKAVAQSGSMKKASHYQFRLRVTATNPRHHSASCCLINDVSHYRRTRQLCYALMKGSLPNRELSPIVVSGGHPRPQHLLGSYLPLPT